MANTTKSINEEKVFRDKYNNDESFRTTINGALGSNCMAVKKVPYSVSTDEWASHRGSKRSSPAKSDMSFFDANDQAITSATFKNIEGRATSSKFEETRAAFLTTLYGNPVHKNNAPLRNAIDDLFTTWQPLSQVLKTAPEIMTSRQKAGICQHQQLGVYINMTDVLNSKVKDIHDKYPNFVKDLMKECLVGQHKFGNTAQKADFYIQRDRNNQYRVVSTSSANFDAIIDKYLFNSKGGSKLNVNMKSSSGKSSTRSHWIRFL